MGLYFINSPAKINCFGETSSSEQMVLVAEKLSLKHKKVSCKTVL